MAPHGSPIPPLDVPLSHHNKGKLEHSNGTMYPLLGPDPIALLNTLFVLLTVGQASLLLLLGTLLYSKRIRKRNATMVNLIIVSLLCTIPPPLLYYGQQILNPEPPFSLCLAQAVLKHGTDTMFCVAAFSLILEILLQTRIIIWWLDYETSVRLLVGLPYLVFVIFAMWAGVLGGTHHSAVRHEQNDYYCSVAFSAFGRGIYIVCLVMVSLTMGLEVYAFVKRRNFWRGAPQMISGKRYTKGLYFRVLAFTVCQLFFFVLFGLGFWLQHVATNVIPIAIEAAMPLITFVIFASSRDIRAVWKFWDKSSRDSSLSEEVGTMPTAPMTLVSAMPSQTVSPTGDVGNHPPPLAPLSPAIPFPTYSAIPTVSPSVISPSVVSPAVVSFVNGPLPAIPPVHLVAAPQPIINYLGMDIPDSPLDFSSYPLFLED